MRRRWQLTVTEHYRGAHAASHAHTGFRIYVVGSRGGGGRSGPGGNCVQRLAVQSNRSNRSAFQLLGAWTGVAVASPPGDPFPDQIPIEGDTRPLAA